MRQTVSRCPHLRHRALPTPIPVLRQGWKGVQNLGEGVVAGGEGCRGLDALKVLGRGINSRLIAQRREGSGRGERERDGPARLGGTDAGRGVQRDGETGDGGRRAGRLGGGAGESEQNVRGMGGGAEV